MALIFYPNIDEPLRGTPADKVELLMEAAERYKAIVLDEKSHLNEPSHAEENKRSVPREISAAYNWTEAARVMREIRELSEASPADKIKKAELLTRLAEVYEVLRAAKMSKLEAVRLALINEAKQLRGQNL
jgi:hypothetical protein